MKKFFCFRPLPDRWPRKLVRIRLGGSTILLSVRGKRRKKNWRGRNKRSASANRSREVVWWRERVAFPPPQLYRWACFARWRGRNKRSASANRSWEAVWWGERLAFPPHQLHRWARFARRYFSCLTPFFAFFPHCRAWSQAILILDDRLGAKRSRKTLNRVSSRNNGFVVTWRAWNRADVNNLCSPASNGQALFLLFLFYRTLDREMALTEIPRLTGTHPNGNRTLTS